MIRHATLQDAERIAEIYSHYIEKTVATFEEDRVTQAEMASRISTLGDTHPWLVGEAEDTLIGYAYAAPWHVRSAYRLSVETTVYLAPESVGQSWGTRLYRALIDKLRNQDFHCAIGGIALPNDASVALHEKLGFRKVAEFAEVGFKFGKWINVGYWELIL